MINVALSACHSSMVKFPVHVDEYGEVPGRDCSFCLFSASNNHYSAISADGVKASPTDVTGSNNSIEWSLLLSNISVFFSFMAVEEQLIDMKNEYNESCSRL